MEVEAIIVFFFFLNQVKKLIKKYFLLTNFSNNKKARKNFKRKTTLQKIKEMKQSVLPQGVFYVRGLLQSMPSKY
jgi:hypothetical protein